MSELTDEGKIELPVRERLGSDPLLERAREAALHLGMRIFDSAKEAEDAARDTIDAFNDAAHIAGLVDEAVVLRSETITVPMIGFGPEGDYFCSPDEVAADPLEGVAVVQGDFNGFTYVLRPITYDDSEVSGYVAQMCYQISMDVDMRVPYFGADTVYCGYSPVDGAQLEFLVDIEAERAKASTERLAELCPVAPGVAELLEDVIESLNAEDEFSPDLLRYIGGLIRALVASLESEEDITAKHIRDALSDLIKARLQLPYKSAVEIAAGNMITVHRGATNARAEYRLSQDATIRSSIIDVDFAPIFYMEGDKSVTESNKRHLPSLVFSASREDGEEFTVLVPFEEITHLEYTA
jgi:hypothetical protein